MTAFRREVRPTLTAGELRVNWYLHGPEATVQFVLRVVKGDPDPRWPSLPTFRVDPWDIGIHYRNPPEHADYCGYFENCDVADADCWYDGSSLAPERLLSRVLDEKEPDEDAIWAELESWYPDPRGEGEA